MSTQKKKQDKKVVAVTKTTATKTLAKGSAKAATKAKPIGEALAKSTKVAAGDDTIAQARLSVNTKKAGVKKQTAKNKTEKSAGKNSVEKKLLHL